MHDTMESALKYAVTETIKQGYRCHKDGQCMLRFKGGKCSIGHLITDKRYKESSIKLPLEELHIFKLYDLGILNINFEFSAENFNQLDSLQGCHDNAVEKYDRVKLSFDGNEFVIFFKNNLMHKIKKGELPKYLQTIIERTS